MIHTGFPSATISSKRDEDEKSMPDLCQDDLNSSDVEEESKSYLQLCFAIGDDEDLDAEMGEEISNKSQHLVELSQTKEIHLCRSDVNDVASSGNRTGPRNISTTHDNKISHSFGANPEDKTGGISNDKPAFRALLRKSRSVSLLAVECSANSSPFFELDRSDTAEESDLSDDDCKNISRGARGSKNNFPSTSTHSTSSAGSVSQSIVQLRRKLKDRSTANRRPMWSSSLTSSLTSSETKRQDKKCDDDDESHREDRSCRRSRIGSAKSCADSDVRSKRNSKSSATCAEPSKTARSRLSSSASVQVTGSEVEPAVRSRRSSGSSVQGIITFVTEAASSHKRGPPPMARSSLMARLPSSRVGRRSSASSEVGDVDPLLLGAECLSPRVTGCDVAAKAGASSLHTAAKEEMQHRTRKLDVSARRERRIMSTMQ